MPQFVGGRYQLIAQLGGGGMADVYLAKLSGKGEFAKLSVVKRLKPAEDDDPETFSMFADEARLCARLNHPSIVQTFEVGEDENGPFLVMEYVEGQSLGRLRSRAQRRGLAMPRAMALKIVRETVGALEYAHNLLDHDGSVLRVVHRDVSPENIMVTYAGVTKLIDFGVAKTAASMSKTRAGVLKGKVAYMAPEQARSDENIDERVDVFAIGLILWELLTGQRMWEGMSEAKVFERLLDRSPLARARDVDADIPAELDAICAKAVAKNKDDRYANMAELMDALETAVAKLDLRASDREIGQFVSELFEVEREKVKQLVVTASAKKDDSPSEPQVFDDTSDPLLWRGASTGTKSAPTEGSSKSDKSKEISKVEKIQPTSLLPAAGGSLSNSMTAGGVENTKVAAAQMRKSPLKPVLAAAALVVVVIVAVMVGKNMTANDTPVTADKPPEPPIPVIDTNVTPSTPAPTEETVLDNNVSIEITVRPTNARIYLDGNKVTGNPYHLKTSRGSATHELRADADGFETRTMALVFDKDRDIELSLSRASPGYVPPPRPDQAGPTPRPRPAPAPEPAAPAPAPAPANAGDPNKP